MMMAGKPVLQIGSKLVKLNSKDSLFIMSVGGGNIKKKVSMNLVEAINYGKKKVRKYWELLEGMVDF